MLKRAKLVLTSNVSKSSTQSENYFDEAATQTQASQSSTAKPVLNQLHFVTTPTMSSSSSHAKFALNQRHSSPGEEDPNLLATSTSAAKPARDQLQSFPESLESTTLTLTDVFTKLLECRRSFKGESCLCPHEGNFSNADAPVLQEWQRVSHPSHKVRKHALFPYCGDEYCISATTESFQHGGLT